MTNPATTRPRSWECITEAPDVAFTHGWRIYQVKGTKLYSPFTPLGYGDELPYNGVMDYCYFVPDYIDIWRLQFTNPLEEAIPVHETALTFGLVEGPFWRDQLMPYIHSAKCSRYKALCIVSRTPNHFLGAYNPNLPLIKYDDYPESLQAIQTQLIAQPNEPVKLPCYQLHVTFICTYNVARSPMAEKMFRQQLHERGVGDVVRVTSAGTDAFQTGGMDTRAAVQLIENGYATKHEPAKLSMQNLNADMVIAMDSYNARKLLNLGVPLDRLKFLRNFDRSADFATRDITNPCHDQDFEPTFQTIAAALPGLHGWVDNQLSRKAASNGYC